MSVDKELLKGSTQTLVLTLLARKEMYGYQLIKELELLSGGLFELREGTLYPILHALEAEGCVRSEWSSGDGARQRKYYSITKAGRAALKDKKVQWSEFRSAVDRVVFG